MFVHIRFWLEQKYFAGFMFLQRVYGVGVTPELRCQTTSWWWCLRASVSSFFTAVFPPDQTRADLDGVGADRCWTAVLVFPEFAATLEQKKAAEETVWTTVAKEEEQEMWHYQADQSQLLGSASEGSWHLLGGACQAVAKVRCRGINLPLACC